MLYEIASYVTAVFGLQWLSALVLLGFAVLMLRALRRRKVDIVVIVLVLIAYPALTPMMTLAAGFQQFTAMNADLQYPTLIAAAMLLILLFFGAVYAGSLLPVNPARPPRMVLPSFSRGMFLGISLLNVVLVFLFLEAGTILFQTYGTLKSVETPFSSVVHQFFNLSVAVLIVGQSDEKRGQMIKMLLLAFIVISLLMARRNMTAGLGILLLYLISDRLTLRQILTGAVLLGLMVFIGEARRYGLSNFLEATTTVTPKEYFGLYGGGSNVFMSVMGVIHVNTFGALPPEHQMPLLTWPQGIIENRIYEGRTYAYNGGMHLASVFYWNFGLLGVALGGLLMGWGVRIVDTNLSALRTPGPATFGKAVAVLFALSVTGIMWYHPLGFIKAFAALSVGAILLGLLPVRSVAIDPSQKVET